MKPMHVAILIAVIAVGVVLFFMLGGEQGRSTDRRGTDRGTSSNAARGAGGEEQGAGAEEDARRRAGRLSVTLAVLMPDGSPAGRADVELIGPEARRAVADAKGSVKVEALLPGLYNLLASRGNATGSLGFELKRTLDLGVLRLATSVAIRGRVYDPERKPIAGAVVEAVRDESTGFNMMTFVKLLTAPEQVAARARTDASGAYELRVAAGSRFGLRATADGYAQEGEGSRVFLADAEGLDFFLFPGVELAGRVIEVAGTPVAGARVMLLDPLSALGRRVPKVETISAANGSFALATLPREDALLIVRATGFATFVEEKPELPSHDRTITLEPGISLRLRTVDADQPARPAPFVNAVLVYRGSFSAGRTDAEGMLLLENLPSQGSGTWGGQQQGFLWGGDYVGRQLTLASQEPEDGLLDLGEVEMTRGGTVKGKVKNSRTGEGVAGARVRAFGGLDPQMMLMTSGVTSEADGSFVLRGVPRGATLLVADHPDYASEFNPLALAQGMRGGGGTPLFPEGVREIERDIELTPASVVTGLVLAPDGAPVAGAKVEVRDPLAMISRMFGSGPPTAISDAEGRFTLGGLKQAQEVELVATHREFGASEARKVRAGADGVELRLAEPLLIEGVVVDEGDAAVAGVRVTVERAKEQSPRNLVGVMVERATRPSVTDAQGRFTLRNAPPGELVVSFDHSGYMEEKVPLTVRPGTKTETLERTVLRRGLGIEGVAVDESGEPLGSVAISATYAGDWSKQAPGRSNGSDRTDEKGRFAIHGLREGEFEVRTWQPGYFADALRVPAGTLDARLVLKKAGTLLGRVLGNGRPVGNASVRAEVVTTDAQGASDTQFLAWGQTDADGLFQLRPVPPNRPFRLNISHDAHRDLVVPDARASDRRQDFHLETGIRIAGTVVDEEDRPVANANITVAVGGNQVKSVRSAADGRWAAGGLDGGEITVQLQESGQNFISSEPLPVDPGERGVRIVARRGESISGVVLSPDGKPAGNVQVRALDAGGNSVATDWVWRADGAFTLRGLPRGSYTLTAQRGGKDASEGQAVAEGIATGTTGVELSLPEN